MAAGSDGHRDNCSKNDASQPLTKETTATKTSSRQRFTTRRRDLRTTPGTPTFSHIPFEIVSAILVRLPVKPLLRFRCVCKTWNALISDPNFATEQLRASSSIDEITHSRRRLHLMVAFNEPRGRNRELLLDDYSFPSLFNDSIVGFSQHKFPSLAKTNSSRFLQGSCHGLLLCVASPDCFVWNPLTGKFKNLLPLGNHWPNLSFVVYGFGHDHLSDSYKVVVLGGTTTNVVSNVEFEYHARVQTLGTDSWRVVHGCPGIKFSSYWGKFVSGTLNWLANSFVGSRCLIVSLDLGTETFQQLLLPNFGSRSDVSVIIELQVIKGWLCILADCNMASDVWLMMEYGNKDSWTKVFTIPHVGLGTYRNKIKEVLFISDDGEEILLKCLMSLVVYNCKSGTFKKLGVRKFRGCCFSEVFVESLISPC